ncbi:hypothetical protein COBT_001217 [Conglomerata obtusa]
MGNKKPNFKKFCRTFKERIDHFVDLIYSSSDLFYISDLECTNYFSNNIDLILYSLALNFKCTCHENIEVIGNSLFVFVNDCNQKHFYKLSVPNITCKELNLQLIIFLIDMLHEKNTYFEADFYGYKRYIFELVNKFQVNCYSYVPLMKAYKKIIDKYLDESYEVIFSEKFVKGICTHVRGLGDLFKRFININRFAQIIINERIANRLIHNICDENYEMLDIILNIFNLIDKRYRTEINFIKFFDDARESINKLFELFINSKNVLDGNKIIELLKKIITNTQIDDVHLGQLVEHMKKSKVLCFKESCNKLNSNFMHNSKKFDSISQIITIKELHIIYLISLILQTNKCIMIDFLRQDNLLDDMLLIFFSIEECSYLHKSVVSIILSIFDSNINENYVCIQNLIDKSKTGLIYWGKEYFARENESCGQLKCLSTFCVSLYQGILNLQKRCFLKNSNNEQNNHKIIDLIGSFIESEDFLICRHFYERNINKKKLNTCSLDDVNVNNYLEDCISEAHIRYTNYLISKTLPKTDLFYD